MKKFLVVRFSSIGDIVLTTPVVRCLKAEFPDAEVHYLTKIQFKTILVNNPSIDKIHTIKRDLKEVLSTLKSEKYDWVIDLHNNLRTLNLRWALHTKSYQFPKINLKKWLLTTFKVNKMPTLHVVDRYFQAVEELGVKNDQKGLDYFIPKVDDINLKHYHIPQNYIAFAIGAKFGTKRLPVTKIVEIINQLNTTVVLLGGKDDVKNAKLISNDCENVVSLCGDLNLNQSASVVKQADKIITHDTGLMHIASAFNKPIVSIWGNTVPALGMYPYMPEVENNYSIHEVRNLSCRPCSKIGYQTCPKKHFNCMNQQDIDAIVKAVVEN